MVGSADLPPQDDHVVSAAAEERPDTAVVFGLCKRLIEQVADANSLIAPLSSSGSHGGAAAGFWLKPLGLSGGLLGLGYAIGYLAGVFGREDWLQLSHDYLRTAVAATHEHPVALPGLSSGSAGLGFCVNAASHMEPRFAPSALRIAQQVAKQTMAFPYERMTGSWGVTCYDVISGASGIVSYLCDAPDAEEVSIARDRLLTALVTFVTEDAPARWVLTPEAMARSSSPAFPIRYPRGCYDLGLAHGLAGPLAALSKAKLRGHEVAGQASAITRLADWMWSRAIEDEVGITWPQCWPQDEGALWPTRSAWCYGSPGVCRSLWLAGEAVGDRKLAEQAMEALMLTRVRQRGTYSAGGLCHGTPGHLVILNCFLRDAPSPELQTFQRELVSVVVSSFSDEARFGYVDLLQGGYDDIIPGEARVDNPGLLTGSMGAAVALGSSVGPMRPGPECFMLL